MLQRLISATAALIVATSITFSSPSYSPSLAEESSDDVFFVSARRANEIAFEKTTAKQIRVTIAAWNSGDAPCVDEIQVFNGAVDQNADAKTVDAANLARRSGVKVAASSVISGYAVHKTEHLIDGRFGNDASWVAKLGDAVPSFVLTWPESVEFDRVVFSRDRENRYSDRVPTRLEVAASDDGETWRVLWANEKPAFVAEPATFADAFSQWFANVPDDAALGAVPFDFAVVDAAPVSTDKTGKVAKTDKPTAPFPAFPIFSQYDRQLRDAFLFEEIAWLKAAGFGQVERRLRQRNYPERVESQIPLENVVPLPLLFAQPSPIAPNAQSAPNSPIAPTSLSDAEIERQATRATVATVSSLDRFEPGPLLAQSATAALVGDELFLKISGNRFVSRRLALVGVENAPIRGLLVLRDDDSLVWRRLDAVDAAPAGEEIQLNARFDRATGSATVRIPLAWLPGLRKRGLTVGLGLGGRWEASGGRPIHFVPANFALSALPAPDADGSFAVELTAASKPVELELSSAGAPNGTLENALKNWRFTVRLEPGETTCVSLPAQLGLVGPEFRLRVADQTAGSPTAEVDFLAVLLRYDPTRRQLDLFRELVERETATDLDAVERVHYRQGLSIPGAVNPLYVDVDAEKAAVAEERAALEFAPFDELAPETRALAERLIEFEQKRAALAVRFAAAETSETLQSAQTAADFNGSTDSPARIAAERALAFKIKSAKRERLLAASELAPASKILFNKRAPFHPSHNYSDLFDSVWRPGGAVATLEIPFPDGGRLEPENARVDELIPAGVGIIRNPSLSFDAATIFFAWRRNQSDYFRIFEYDVATKTARRISPDGPFHDFWPTQLPDGGLAFVSTRCKKKFICWRPQAFVLHRMERDGSNLRELSNANLSEFAPSVKDDGRLLWTRSEYVDKGADYGHTLWTICADGTTPELVFGNTINLPQGYANGRDVPETNEVCAIGVSHFGDLNGPLMFLDLTNGPHDPARIRSLTPEVPWPGAWAATETFREPVPISRNVVLVAWANRDRFALWLVDRFGNREFLFQDDDIDSICPQPFRARPLPPVRLGALDPELAERGVGRFSVENVYTGLEGYVEPGAAKYLRICQEMPAWLDQNPDGTFRTDHEPFEEWYAAPTDRFQGAFGWPSYVAKGVLGTVPVESDGSAEFYAPANKVLFFQLLDENFNEIQRMRSVVQLQPGEQRACVGCHENRLLTPEGSITEASKKPTATPVAPPWGAGPFHFEQVVQPVLDRKCASCHSPNAANSAETSQTAASKFDLTATTDANRIPASYKSLLASGAVHYFDYLWSGGLTTKAAPYSFGVSKSSLFEILRDKNHRDVALTLEEEQALKCWIDLNVPLWGDYRQRRTRPENANPTAPPFAPAPVAAE